MDESNYAGGWIGWLPLLYICGRGWQVLTCCCPVAGVDAVQTRSQALRVWLLTGMWVMEDMHGSTMRHAGAGTPILFAASALIVAPATWILQVLACNAQTRVTRLPCSLFVWAFADGPYAVVLAPTRELAQQIEEETVKLAKYTDFKWVHMLAVLCAVLVCIALAQLDHLWWVRQPNASPSACCCLVPWPSSNQ
jgi:hypothetical protein